MNSSQTAAVDEILMCFSLLFNGHGNAEKLFGLLANFPHQRNGTANLLPLTISRAATAVESEHTTSLYSLVPR
jgi:hypothetical protein